MSTLPVTARDHRPCRPGVPSCRASARLPGTRRHLSVTGSMEPLAHTLRRVETDDEITRGSLRPTNLSPPNSRDRRRSHPFSNPLPIPLSTGVEPQSPTQTNGAPPLSPLGVKGAFPFSLGILAHGLLVIPGIRQFLRGGASDPPTVAPPSFRGPQRSHPFSKALSHPLFRGIAKKPTDKTGSSLLFLLSGRARSLAPHRAAMRRQNRLSVPIWQPSAAPLRSPAVSAHPLPRHVAPSPLSVPLS